MKWMIQPAGCGDQPLEPLMSHARRDRAPYRARQNRPCLSDCGGGTAIITRWDVAGALRAHGSDASITSASGAEGIIVNEDLSVIDTAARMLRHEIRHVVVCDGGGRVVGLVGLHDLVRILIDAMDPSVWVMLRRTMLTAHGATGGGK